MPTAVKISLAFVCGVASFFALMALADLIASNIGVPLSVDYGVTLTVSDRYGDYEDDGLTDFGYCVTLLALMCAGRVGMSVYHLRIDGDLSKRQEMLFQAWIAGLAILATLGALIFLAFQDVYSGLGRFVQFSLKFGALLAVFWAMKTWYDQRLKRLEKIAGSDALD